MNKLREYLVHMHNCIINLDECYSDDDGYNLITNDDIKVMLKFFFF